MSSIDKAAIGWSIGIVTIFIGISFGVQGVEDTATVPTVQDVQEKIVLSTTQEEPVMRGWGIDADKFLEKMEKKLWRQCSSDEDVKPSAEMSWGSYAFCDFTGGFTGKYAPYFTEVDLTGAKFQNMWLKKHQFRQSILSSADFSGANLNYAMMTNNRMYDTGFVNTNLTGANLSGSDIKNADFTGAVLSFAKMQGVDLSTSKFNVSALSSASLINSNLTGVNLSGMDLSWSKFTNANLTGADLSNTYIMATDFTNANLTNADLRGANTISATFTGAITDGCLGCP